MKKFAVLLIALCLVVGLSGAAFGEHRFRVWQGDDDGWEAGVDVIIGVETAPGVWSYVYGQTDQNGWFAENLLLPWEDALQWKVILNTTSGRVPVNPPDNWTNFVAEGNNNFVLHVQWL